MIDSFDEIVWSLEAENDLDEIKKDAGAIFLLGDLFDFWFEYKTVVINSTA